MAYYTKFGMMDNDVELVRSAAAGPPGIGFKLTRDGQYDIDFKRLTRVSEGVHAQDVVTKRQSEDLINHQLTKAMKLQGASFSADNKRISNLAKPEEPNDAVRIFEMQKLEEKLKVDPDPSNALEQKKGLFVAKGLNFTNGDVYDAKGKRIINVSEPQNHQDAVTRHYVNINLNHLRDSVKSMNKVSKDVTNMLERRKNGLYVPESLKLFADHYDASNRRVANIGRAADLHDAVNLQVLNENVSIEKDKHNALVRRGGLFVPQSLPLTNDGYDAQDRRIIKMADPEDDKDGANVEYVKKSLSNFFSDDVLDVKNRRIVNVGAPIEDDHATTKTYVDSLLQIDPSDENGLTRTDKGLFATNPTKIDPSAENELKRTDSGLFVSSLQPLKTMIQAVIYTTEEKTKIDPNRENALTRTKDGLLVSSLEPQLLEFTAKAANDLKKISNVISTQLAEIKQKEEKDIEDVLALFERQTEKLQAIEVVLISLKDETVNIVNEVCTLEATFKKARAGTPFQNSIHSRWDGKITHATLFTTARKEAINFIITMDYKGIHEHIIKEPDTKIVNVNLKNAPFVANQAISVKFNNTFESDMPHVFKVSFVLQYTIK